MARLSSIDSPIMEHEQEGYDCLDDSEEETAFSSNGCNCFGLFFTWRPNNNSNERQYLKLNEKGSGEEHGDTWVETKLKKVKEVTEVLAGPKWKTLIRKIGGYVKNKRQKHAHKFQYDPKSYALNFDDGV